MTRLEKIVLEQKIRKGNMGVRKIDGPLSSRTAKYFTNVDDLVTSFYYVDKHGKQGKGKKYTPLTSNELVQRWLPTLFELQKYNTKDYIVILDTNSQVTDKTESVWDVFVVNRNSISKIPDSDIKKLGNVGSAPLISLIEFQRLKKQVELVALATKEKADAEAASELEKKKPAIEKTKVVVQNILKGTSTIDDTNLGKGTEDAKAFQELLWQYGNKYPTQKSSTIYINFAKFRTKGPDGGWDGDIGPSTKKYITFLYGGLNVNTYTELIKKINLDLNQVQTESINYFKGTGINIKLKDLLQEQLLKEQDGFDFAAAEAAVKSSGAGGGGGGGGNTPKPTNKTFTQATLPAGYTGTGKITYDNGNTFEGSWKDRKKQGQGTYTWSNGNKHVGKWIYGFRSGPGIHTIGTGNAIKTYTGEWSGGMRNGEFKITYPNGDIRVGTFINNVFGGLVKFTPKGGKSWFTPKGGESVEERWKDGKKLPFLDIEDMYKKSVADMSDVLLKLVNYVNNNKTFAGYKSTIDDDEKNALNDLVKPWVRANIQPKVTNHYNKYIKPYMSQYNVSDAALNIEYDLEYVGTNNSVTNISNTKFRKIFQNYLVLKANSSNTALNHPTRSAAYYNYPGDKSSYTIPCMFYYNYERSVHYWNLAGGRALFNVDTDF